MKGNRQDAVPETAAGRGSGTAAKARQRALEAEEVAAYLRRHPDFFARHPDLLDVLAAPNPSQDDRVVDLRAAMVQRLRSRYGELKSAHDDLLTTGRGNLHAQARVHEAVLALLGARSFEHLIESMTTDLAIHLDLDAVALCVEQAMDGLPPSRVGGVLSVPVGTIDDVLGSRNVHLLQGERDETATLFQGAAGIVRSQALLRLAISPATPPALLALGSRDADHFSDGQGTELLLFLGHCIEHLLCAWLELPD